MIKTITAILLTIICLSGFTAGARALDKTDNRAAVTVNNVTERYGYDALSTEVNDIVNRVEAIKLAGTANEQRKQFITLKQEIEKLDDKIDMVKDKVKTDYISETLSWDEYRNIEQQLDALEDKLDQAEDKLDSMFRIGD